MYFSMINGVDFEADSPAATGQLLGAENDAWRKRQCVDKDWFKKHLLEELERQRMQDKVAVCSKGIRRGSLARESELLYPGESCERRCVLQLIVRSVRQKEKLTPDGDERVFGIESVSAGREGRDGAEFLIHRAGGDEAWGDGAATWQSLSKDAVIGVWERLAAAEGASLREQQELDATQGQ